MEIMEETNMITLMLNPGNSEQDAVRTALQEELRVLLECFAQRGHGPTELDDRRYAALKQTAFDALTSIGVSTWSSIKKLE
jgi:hypothetical protein